jgi:dinuclear metal center YbgI/SA1388 family protein
MTSDRVADWLAVLDDCYPTEHAQEWDEVGLHVGDPDEVVNAILITLDVTLDVIAEARRLGADLIIAHHPLFFRPLARLTPGSAAGRIALAAARHGVAIAAAHTNFDVAAAGTSDPIVQLLGLRDVTAMQPVAAQAWTKVVTFVPVAHTAEVLKALAEAGAGRFGEYDSCSFRVTGTGSFRPSDKATPAIGRAGELTQVEEDRIEVVATADVLSDVVAALISTHPYEEVAYDLIPLRTPHRANSALGLGRVGTLQMSTQLGRIAQLIAEELPAPGLRLAGDPERCVERVAVCGGAGDSLINTAISAGADLYITGDLRHHPTLDARTRDLALIDAGHYWTEVAALPAMLENLREAGQRHGLGATLVASTVQTDPWVSSALWQLTERERTP